MVDTTFVKNVYGKDVVGRNPTDRGRFATKVSLLTDSQGTPLCSVFHKANKNDSQTLKHLLETANRKTNILRNYTDILGDKGYDSITCRATCQVYGLNALIPRRRTNDYYHGRYVIEQTFGILDQFRRVRVRYDSLIRNFKSFHYIALLCIIGKR